MLPVIGTLRPWADPSITHLRRLPMHTPLHGFDRIPLDGDWSLAMFEHPDQVLAQALIGQDCAGVSVHVPGNWTMQDLGDFVDSPHYTNVQMPFPGPPPLLPERNPTGVYRRTVSVPSDWASRRTVLHIGGAESVHAVYLNGSFVGYGTDSRLPSEYDVSEFVHGGDNDLAIVVIRFSAHSYVEDQDQWWMAGLHRSVWLEARPTTHIADLIVTTDFDPTTDDGTVAATAMVHFAGAETQPGWTARWQLSAPDGHSVGQPVTLAIPDHHRQPYVFEGFQVTARWALSSARPWSAEVPQRYRVDVELIDPSGASHHQETVRVGVKRVQVAERQLQINGKPAWIFGVNRHDHHPDRAKAVTVADMRNDLVAMRRLNINAIRCSHYPNDDQFLELCDEVGFYVVDEANIECHAYNRSIADDSNYRATFLDRGARMVQRDRNHACVILWSLGNESGYGANHDALAGWIRRADAARPLHYEDAIRVEGWVDGGRQASDVVCPMYPEIAQIEAYGRDGLGDRPLIMCEYSHAMGNSNGSLADYWEVIRTTPGLQGGFLWEWKDHGLRQRLADGRVRLAYGGQFGEHPHDSNFVADGLMSADLEPHPAAHELAWVYRPVTVELDESALLVLNRRSFRGLDDLRAEWELLVDGAQAAHGELSVAPIAPGRALRVMLPCPVPAGDADVRLSVRWTTRDESWFAPAGHLVAWDQVVICEAGYTLLATETEVDINPPWSQPVLNLFRAATDNDGFKLMPDLALRLGVGGQAMTSWIGHGVDATDPEQLVHHRYAATGNVHHHVVTVPDQLADLARVGAMFTVPPRFDRVRYWGRGGHENYPDRRSSAMLAIWEGEIDELPYLVPQEFGLRTECRWFELICSASGERVRIDSVEQPMHISATRYSPGTLFAASQAIDLVAEDRVVVCVDVAHRGLGTASCGPDVLDRYRLPAGEFAFAYRLSYQPA